MNSGSVFYRPKRARASHRPYIFVRNNPVGASLAGALYLAIAAFIMISISACSNKANNKSQNENSKGELHVVADADLQPIIRQELEVFRYANDSVQVNAVYESEDSALTDFVKGKASVLVLSRGLTPGEKQRMEEKDTIFPRQVEIAFDAVALVANKEFDDRSLDIEQLKSFFNGASGNAPQLVFEKQSTGVVKYMLNVLGYNGKVSSNIYALKTPDEIVEYVGRNKNTIGFIPFNFLSNDDDERVKKLFERIKVLSLRAKNEKGEEIRASANQSDIAAGVYPLMRTITTITRFSYGDSKEWSLVDFMMRQRGARIFLKAGLIPAKMPGREINVNTVGLKANK